MRCGKYDRIAEWLMIRRTGTLNDIVDEAAFMKLCGVDSKESFRLWNRRRTVHGIEFPCPVFRADSHKGVWLKSEAEEFARLYRAKKAIRKKR